MSRRQNTIDWEVCPAGTMHSFNDALTALREIVWRKFSDPGRGKYGAGKWNTLNLRTADLKRYRQLVRRIAP